MTTSRAVGLQIDEDPVFERRSSHVERIGTWLMVAVVVAAGLGLLGSGPLSGATARAHGIVLDYQRLARYESSHTLRLHLEAAAVPSPEVRLWLDRDYLEGVRLESVLPPPIRVEAAPDRLIFVFAVAEPGRPLTVTLGLQPERLGRVQGRAGLGDRAAAAVTFQQFVFP